MPTQEEIAARISEQMRTVAQPDSHFHLDFSQFIPGFAGSETAAARLLAHPFYRAAGNVFVTPDNGLIPLRRCILADGKDIVLPSYGLHRGFILVEAAAVPKGQEIFASWLDGVDHFGRVISLAELAQRGGFDLIATGASAVGTNGLRFGMGARYLDVEWGIFAEAGLVSDDTQIAAVVHDLQVVDHPFPILATDVCVDVIVTPARLMEITRKPRPTGLDRSLVDSTLEGAPPLRELEA